MNPFRTTNIVGAALAPRTNIFRLLWAYLFRGLNAKLKRHWLRSLTSVEAEELELFDCFAYHEEKNRRHEHLRKMAQGPANFNRTKIKPFLMKYLFLLLLLVTSCHPRFPREEAKALLEVKFSNVKVNEYEASADCFDNRRRSFIWSAQDNKGMPVAGVLCCDSHFSCLVFEKNP